MTDKSRGKHRFVSEFRCSCGFIANSHQELELHGDGHDEY